jgi:hypothetical protein
MRGLLSTEVIRTGEVLITAHLDVVYIYWRDWWCPQRNIIGQPIPADLNQVSPEYKLCTSLNEWIYSI